MNSFGAGLHVNLLFMTEDEEEARSSDRTFWYIIAGQVGIPVSIFCLEIADSIFVALVAWFAWLLCIWLLERFGFWIATGHFLGAAWRPFGVVLGAVWRPFGVGVGVTVRFIAGFFSVVGTVLGALVLFAIFAFFFLGVIGLLWFGITQIF